MEQSAFIISQILNERQVLKHLPKRFDVKYFDGLFEILYDNKTCAYFNITMGKLFVEIYSPEKWSLSIQSRILEYLRDCSFEIQEKTLPVIYQNKILQ